MQASVARMVDRDTLESNSLKAQKAKVLMKQYDNMLVREELLCVSLPHIHRYNLPAGPRLCAMSKSDCTHIIYEN